MNDHALRVLEYDRAREIVARFAATEPGRDRAQSAQPSTERAVVGERLGEAAEFLQILQEGEQPPFDGVQAIGQSLERMSVAGTILQPAELLALGSTLGAARRIKAFFRRIEDAPSAGSQQRASLLCSRAGRIVVLKDIEDRISATVDETGEVKDSASPELRRLRKLIARTRDDILDRMGKILRQADSQNIVQEQVVTVRDDRYVIPLKPNFRQGLTGVVHGHSGSRATLFVEPIDVLEQNNRLAELRMDERDEVERILRELTSLLAGHAGEIAGTFDAVTGLDEVHARGRFAKECGATIPAISPANRLLLREARHPLLVWKRKTAPAAFDVMPNDVELAEDRRALIISGPNAGGKTVILKTVGLLSLMAQAGMPVTAAEGSEVPVFKDLFADIGDEQDLEQDLSTFSSHISRIAEILREADAGSLVLLDELGTGTDPSEGAALGSSVLAKLLERGCMTVVTTHHGSLKLFGARTAGAVNAAMEFDPETLKPTYRFIPGRPGRSYGLDLAKRLGIPDSVIHDARSRISGGEAGLDRLLEQLEDDSRRLRAEREQAEADRRTAAVLKADAEASAKAAAEEARTARSKARQDAREVLSSLRTKLKEFSRTASMTPSDIQAERSGINELSRQLEPAEEALFETASAVSHALHAGDRVRMPRLNRTGTVLFLHKDAVEVDSNGMKLKLPLAAVVPVEQAKQGSPAAAVASGWKAELQEREGLPDKVMLLGMRVDEALEETARFIDRSSMQGFGQVLVVHGLGTGALKAAVTAFLKGHPLVSSIRPAEPAEGGAGATVAELKK
ncbi:MAG: endonuclease MutS2 [Nitrospirota bacterium]|nr:endonuclease MutS2 [Nitrospirota bacterium]